MRTYCINLLTSSSEVSFKETGTYYYLQHPQMDLLVVEAVPELVVEPVVEPVPGQFSSSEPSLHSSRPSQRPLIEDVHCQPLSHRNPDEHTAKEISLHMHAVSASSIFTDTRGRIHNIKLTPVAYKLLGASSDSLKASITGVLGLQDCLKPSLAGIYFMFVMHRRAMVTSVPCHDLFSYMQLGLDPGGDRGDHPLI